MSRSSTAIRRALRAPRQRRFVVVRRRVKRWWQSRTILIMGVGVEMLSFLEFSLNKLFPEDYKWTVLILGTVVAGLSMYLRLTTTMPVAFRKPTPIGPSLPTTGWEPENYQ